MRLEVQQEQRAEDARVAQRRGELQHAGVDQTIRQAEIEMHGRSPAVGALERRCQWLEQPGKHER
jgi:hypothetical protein